jgi:hypothetical protein
MNPGALDQIQERIVFLQEQLDSLEHFLPETYQFLMAEMDHQQRELMALKIKTFYEDQSNEHQDQIPHSGNPDQTQKSNHRAEGVHQ